MTVSWTLSLAAGVLTVAAPCSLPLLPVVLGGVAAGEQERRWRPVVIVASLAVSVVAFTLLLKASSALLGVPPEVWQVVSGGILVLLGLDFVAPALWDRVSVALGLGARAGRALHESVRRRGILGDILTGAALGPVFTSCSPTYLLIVAVVLPSSFAQGVGHVVAYAVGLAVALLAIALLGRGLVSRLGWVADPGGWFRRVVGVLFVLVGVAVVLGLDKQAQTWVLDAGWYAPVAELERWIGGR